MVFGVNHVGGFLLTGLLMPVLREAAVQSGRRGSTRVVNLTSAAHRISPIRFNDWNFEKTVAELPKEERPAEDLPRNFYKEEDTYTGLVQLHMSEERPIRIRAGRSMLMLLLECTGFWHTDKARRPTSSLRRP